MKKLKQFSIMLIITTVLIFFAEYFYKKIKDERISHTIFHHTFAPNKVFFDQWGKNKYKLCTDNNGFRIKCGSNSYKDFDIAFIGDSFTEGSGGGFEETFVGMIANEFPDLKIANLGVVSYTPSIYLTKVRYYLEKGITFKRLIVYMDISDIQDEVIYSIENGKVKQIAHINKKDNAVPYTLSRRIKNELNWRLPITYRGLFTLKNLLLYQKQEEYKETSFRFERDHARSGWTYNSEIDGYGEIGLDGAIKKTIRVMQELHKLTEQYGIKLSVAVYPWPGQVLFDVENSLQVQIWKKFCENRCEYFINSFPSIFNLSKQIGKQQTIDKMYIKGDVHYNYAGNEVLYLDFLKVFNKGY